MEAKTFRETVNEWTEKANEMMVAGEDYIPLAEAMDAMWPFVLEYEAIKPPEDE